MPTDVRHGHGAPFGFITIPVGATMEEAKLAIIVRTLEAMNLDKSEAARHLDISLKTIYNVLNKHKITIKPATFSVSRGVA